jgi:hypothetical protein
VVEYDPNVDRSLPELIERIISSSLYKNESVILLRPNNSNFSIELLDVSTRKLTVTKHSLTRPMSGNERVVKVTVKEEKKNLLQAVI